MQLECNEGPGSHAHSVLVVDVVVEDEAVLVLFLFVKLRCEHETCCEKTIRVENSIYILYSVFGVKSKDVPALSELSAISSLVLPTDIATKINEGDYEGLL